MMSALLTGPLATLTLSFAAWFLLVNAMTLTAFYVDNRRTMAGDWPVPPKTLLLLALIGGWPAAELAQLWFRHTPGKGPFDILLNLSILPMLGLVGLFAAQEVDWAGLTDQATAKAMALLGQMPAAEATPGTPAKPTRLVMGKTTPGKAAAVEGGVLPKQFGTGNTKSTGAWHSR